MLASATLEPHASNTYYSDTYYSGREPWSGGYGRRLVFQRLCVQIKAPYTGWTFFSYICCKNCDVYLKRQKVK